MKKKVVLDAATVVLLMGLGGAGMPARGQFVDTGKNGAPLPAASDGEGESSMADQREAMARELMQLRTQREDDLARFGAESAELASIDKSIVAIRLQLAAATQWQVSAGSGDPLDGLAGMPTVPVFPRIVQMEPETPAVVTTDETGASVPPAAEETPATGAFEESPQDRDARTAMAKNLVSLAADKRELFKVIASIREQAKVYVEVNWKALEAAGIDQNTPVTLNLDQIPAEKALRLVLQEVGGGTANLDFTIDGGNAVVSTRDDLNSAKYQEVRIYDVRDLLAVGQTYPYFPQMAQGYDIRVTNITDTIKSTVSPDSWRDNGGQIGSIRELNGQLVINQSKDNQRAIAQFLAKLRQSMQMGN